MAMVKIFYLLFIFYIMNFSKTNTILGNFKRYGLFEITLPLVADDNDENRDYLQLYNAFDNDYIFYLAVYDDFVCNELAIGGDLAEYNDPHEHIITFCVDDNDAEKGHKRVKVVLPIIANKDEFLPYREENITTRQDCVVTLLGYSENDGCFVIFYRNPDGEGDRELLLKDGFDYNIKCLGEYKWRKK